jgi:hypothetical protein
MFSAMKVCYTLVVVNNFFITKPDVEVKSPLNKGHPENMDLVFGIAHLSSLEQAIQLFPLCGPQLVVPVPVDVDEG